MENELNLFTKTTPAVDVYPDTTATPITADSIVDLTTITPIEPEVFEGPDVDIDDTIIDDIVEFMDVAIEVVDDFVPPSTVKKLNWFKRLVMSQKRRYKRIKMWYYKLGKFEFDPKLRSVSRDNRQNIIILSKQIDILVREAIIQRATIDDQSKSITALLSQTEENEHTLADLKAKTSMMR